jgi:GAF domain-containing protein
VLWDVRAGGEPQLAAETASAAYLGELRLSSSEQDTVAMTEPVRIPSRAAAAERYPEFPPRGPDARPRFRAWAFLPLVADDQPDGILALGFSRERKFDAQTRRFLCEAAAVCASALAVGSLFSRPSTGS